VSEFTKELTRSNRAKYSYYSQLTCNQQQQVYTKTDLL